MCTLLLIRAETSIQYSSQIRAIVHNDNQMIIFLFMLLLFIFRPIYMYIYILLKIKWTFWALPDSIKLHENQAENLSWNLVPRPISILCSPGSHMHMMIFIEPLPGYSDFMPLRLKVTNLISGGRLNIKISSYQYRDSHVKDKTVSPTVLPLTWESPYLGKTVFKMRRGPAYQYWSQLSTG